ncbi:MAG: AbrB/MazE/SpoVT family DNA-binding domain-containing protein [Alphaproteobacteria bacterium]|nr:AbrB/MazE/SpoVT family DNA-binding domain-containing protein [Alphaproteobacteria bacterium]
MATRVTRKGQITVPKAVRDRLGIGPGSLVEFELNGRGRVVFVLKHGGKRQASKRSRFAAVRGRATVKMSTDAIMALTRGD